MVGFPSEANWGLEFSSSEALKYRFNFFNSYWAKIFYFFCASLIVFFCESFHFTKIFKFIGIKLLILSSYFCDEVPFHFLYFLFVPCLSFSVILTGGLQILLVFSVWALLILSVVCFTLHLLILLNYFLTFTCVGFIISSFSNFLKMNTSIIYLSLFSSLKYTIKAINFPSSTALALFHKFCCVVFSITCNLV